MSMPAVSWTVTGIGTSPIYACDHFQAPFNVGIGCTITGTATYSVQFTFDDIMADDFVAGSATWFTASDFSAVTATKAASFTIPCRGLRLNVSASTGSVKFQVQQAGER